MRSSRSCARRSMHGWAGHRGSGRRQRLPQQRDDGGREGAGSAQLHLGAGPGVPVLEQAAGGSRRRVFQPAPDPRGAGPAAPAVSRGVAGAAVRPRVRDGWDAAGPSSRTSQHLETAARACRRLQPRTAAAAPDRCGHAAEPSGPCRSPRSRPIPAISRPVGPTRTPPAALHATLVANACLAARPERPRPAAGSWRLGWRRTGNC